MTSRRAVLETIGIVTVAVGLLFVLRPSFAASLSVPEAAVALLGAIALIQGVRSLRGRRHVRIDQATPPTPEEPLGTPMPGADFDRSLRSGRVPVAKTRRRLVAAAAESIAIRRDVALSEAERRVEAGTWTDDPVAASYLGGPDAQRLPWRTRVQVIFDGRSFHRFSTERSVEAIAALWEEE